MSEAKDADVGRLSSREIALDALKRVVAPGVTPEHWHPLYFALQRIAALQSLSQEAVRDEALEEAARECGICASRQAIKHDQKVRDQTRRDLAAAIRALKREPNAAAQVSSRTQMPEQSGKRPAPAAPVAEMVRRLEGRASGLDGGIYMYEADAALMRQAATILSRLGQIIHCAERRKDCWPCLTYGASNPLECKVHE